MLQCSRETTLSPYHWRGGFSFASNTMVHPSKSPQPNHWDDECSDPLQYAGLWQMNETLDQRKALKQSTPTATNGASFTFSSYQSDQQRQANGVSSTGPSSERSSWPLLSSESALEKFRTNIYKNDDVANFADKTYTSLSTNKAQRESSVSSGDSTTSVESTPSVRPKPLWSTVVQRNPRPSMRLNRKQKAQVSPKNYSVTVEACCYSPKIKLVCSCCNEERPVKLKDELKPRMIPVSTSQLGFCRFCQTNGDPPEVYQNHSLRSDDGRVTCPVLREYNCPICHNGGGDFAHTVKYCPMARKAKPSK